MINMQECDVIMDHSESVFPLAKYFIQYSCAVAWYRISSRTTFIDAIYCTLLQHPEAFYRVCVLSPVSVLM